MSNDLTLLVGRVLLAIMFLVSGIPMLLAPGGFAGFMGSIGMPAPMLVTWLVIALKVLGGIAIVIGFQTRYVAYAFAAFCVATAFIGHFSPEEMTVFWKNIAVAGGFLALSVAGPGALSVQGRTAA
jgi:putative oxidoreductase